VASRLWLLCLLFFSCPAFIVSPFALIALKRYFPFPSVLSVLEFPSSSSLVLPGRLWDRQCRWNFRLSYFLPSVLNRITPYDGKDGPRYFPRFSPNAICASCFCFPQEDVLPVSPAIGLIFLAEPFTRTQFWYLHCFGPANLSESFLSCRLSSLSLGVSTPKKPPGLVPSSADFFSRQHGNFSAPLRDSYSRKAFSVPPHCCSGLDEGRQPFRPHSFPSCIFS